MTSSLLFTCSRPQLPGSRAYSQDRRPLAAAARGMFGGAVRSEWGKLPTLRVRSIIPPLVLCFRRVRPRTTHGHPRSSTQPRISSPSPTPPLPPRARSARSASPPRRPARPPRTGGGGTPPKAPAGSAAGRRAARWCRRSCGERERGRRPEEASASAAVFLRRLERKEREIHLNCDRSRRGSAAPATAAQHCVPRTRRVCRKTRTQGSGSTPTTAAPRTCSREPGAQAPGSARC